MSIYSSTVSYICRPPFYIVIDRLAGTLTISEELLNRREGYITYRKCSNHNFLDNYGTKINLALNHFW